jgi:formylglycine-generating enzyme required for sulfatase activity
VSTVRLRRLKPEGAEAPKAGAWKVYTEWPFDAAEAKRRQEESAKALGVPVEQDIDLGNGVKMALVLIPAGEFLMGSPPTTSPEQVQKAYGGEPEWYSREFPQRRVKLTQPFWLGKTEVTQAQWQAVMGVNPSHFKDKPQHPVESVSWDDCQGFLQKLSAKLRRPFRLPTEAEWEYACRAGAAAELYFGDGLAALAQHAWCAENAGASTQPVGQTKANAWGLHDMAGNAWEWCEDWFAPYEKVPQTDPRGLEGGGARVLRGGSWDHPAAACRSAYRYSNGPANRFRNIGCRVCVAAKEAVKAARDVRPGEWQSLFDGKTLMGWKVGEHNELKNGEAKVEDGAMVLAARGRLGLAWTGAMPQGDYEVAFDTSLVSGHRLASLLFPVGGGHCDLVLGGISGKLVGLDGVDGKGYRDNPALAQMRFETNHWYAVRVRVAGGRVEVWADGSRLIDLPIAGHTFAVEDQRAALKPLGLSAYQGTTAVRYVRVKKVAAE